MDLWHEPSERGINYLTWGTRKTSKTLIVLSGSFLPLTPPSLIYTALARASFYKQMRKTRGGSNEIPKALWFDGES